jgi:hypothetical protein
MSSKPLVLAGLAVLLFPFATLVRAQDSGPYKVLRIQLVEGDGGFDYVTADPDGRNLYVARSGPAGHIGVFSLDALAQVGDIPGVSAHGGAVDTATGHGFATSKPVTMFDAKTFAILKKIDVQGNPDGYLNDSYNHHFYILSHSEPNITVLDDKDGSILGTIDIGGAPEEAATDGHGKIYVDIEDKAAIAVIDADTMKMVGRYDVSSRGAGCAGTCARCEKPDSLRFVSRQEQYGDSVRYRRAYHHRSAYRRRVRRHNLRSRDDGSLQFPGRWHVDGGEGGFAHQLPRGANGGNPGTSQNADPGSQDQPDFSDYGRVWADSGRIGPGSSSAAGSPGLEASPSPAYDPTLFPDPCNRQMIEGAKALG